MNIRFAHFSNLAVLLFFFLFQWRPPQRPRRLGSLMAIVVSAACMETQQSGQAWQASRSSGGQAITARRYDKGHWDSVRVRCGHALIGYRHQNCPGRD
ncbi:hypothetical protein EDB80DRAFT_728033, partial [Ilyonectria destructans]